MAISEFAERRRAQTAVERAKDLGGLQLPRTHRMPNLLIVERDQQRQDRTGPALCAWDPPQASSGDVPSSIPVVAIEAPPVPDERRLYQVILREVTTPASPPELRGALALSLSVFTLSLPNFYRLGALGVFMLLAENR
jgi:hypothetical protein